MNDLPRDTVSKLGDPLDQFPSLAARASSLLCLCPWEPPQTSHGELLTARLQNQ